MKKFPKILAVGLFIGGLIIGGVYAQGHTEKKFPIEKAQSYNLATHFDMINDAAKIVYPAFAKAVFYFNVKSPVQKFKSPIRLTANSPPIEKKMYYTHGRSTFYQRIEV